jgi:hypothetical protein
MDSFSGPPLEAPLRSQSGLELASTTPRYRVSSTLQEGRRASIAGRDYGCKASL